MFEALYGAAQGMHHSTTDFETVSNNLANVNTAGFRRLVAQHSETPLTGTVAPVAPDRFVLDLAAGPLVHTGSDLDIALDGPGFIELAGPDGPIFTRDGRLHVNRDGVLVSNAGLPVQGEGGPINIPPDAAEIKIDSSGGIYADDVQVGSISIKEPTDPANVARAGDNTYYIADAVASADTRVLQGMHEASNVSAVVELVRMIEAMRRYEAAQKTITTVSGAIEQHTTSN